MGIVYEGINDQISRRVAIKVLHAEICRNAELLARFYNEARATNLASHVGIVDVYELGQLPDGRAFIVMQFLSGESLADRLHRLGGRIPCAEAIRLTRQVASAMEAAHAHGVLHRENYSFSKTCFHLGHDWSQRRRNKPCTLTTPAVASRALT